MGTAFNDTDPALCATSFRASITDGLLKGGMPAPDARQLIDLYRAALADGTERATSLGDLLAEDQGPVFTAIVDAGMDEEGDINLYQLAIAAPDAATAREVAILFGTEAEDRITDIEDPQRWNLCGLWAGRPLYSSGNWCQITAGDLPGSYLVDEDTYSQGHAA
ncbi:hypothetical protein [Streptacidiphilus cavernicola]|uniref:Uncharacterized protein n=1 Tax=Streptacidiphilus cavernicola TaxID=3342716 RepID=A0ABV6VY67_9ACTN